MASYSQTNRLLKFTSPLGENALLIESLEGHEGISRLFEFHAELLADVQQQIDPKQMIGARVSIALALTDVRGFRYISGIVASFEQAEEDTEFNVYHARIVPGLWQSTLNFNCRVFQDKSVLEIVKQVIGEYSLPITDSTSQSYSPLDYCTQYDESDFHFISRLLEQSGISYWFEHGELGHKIVLADDLPAYADCPLFSNVQFALSSGGADSAYGARVTELTATSTMVSGVHSSAEYDFRRYQMVDTGNENTKSVYGRVGFDQYLYPAVVEGSMKKITAGKAQDLQKQHLKARRLESDTTAEIYHGASSVRSFCPGYTYTLKSHPRAAWNRKYLLTSVSHFAKQSPSYRSNDQSGDGYSNSFSSIDALTVYVAPRTADKPIIHGPQTAKVVVPQDEEIHLDKFGRVCVQFFWDKKRKDNTVDNTWVRVAQSWAGNGWGTFFWPRVNDEVIVVFLNGDPDNPIVVGSVYNGVNMPKYALPDHSTRSGVVTRSSKDGAAANANELRFEDKKGHEQIFLNAERDMDHRVEKNHRQYIGGKNSLIVKGDQLETVEGKYSRHVKANAIEKIDGDGSLHINGDQKEKVDGTSSLKVGMDNQVKVGMKYGLDAGMEVHIKGGMNVVIEAGMQLTLKAAGGFVSISPAGVAISGTMVMINSGGAAGSGSGSSPDSPESVVVPETADDGTKGGKM